MTEQEQKEREALLPCPFCGSGDLQSGGDDKWVGFYCMCCGACGPNQYGGTEWNTRQESARATPAQPVPHMPPELREPFEDYYSGVRDRFDRASAQWGFECGTMHGSCQPAQPDHIGDSNEMAAQPDKAKVVDYLAGLFREGKIECISINCEQMAEAIAGLPQRDDSGLVEELVEVLKVVDANIRKWTAAQLRHEIRTALAKHAAQAKAGA